MYACAHKCTLVCTYTKQNIKRKSQTVEKDQKDSTDSDPHLILLR